MSMVRVLLLAAPLLYQPQKDVSMTRFWLAPTGQDLALQLGDAGQQLRLATQLLLVALDSLCASVPLYAEGVRPRRGLKELLTAPLATPDVDVEGGTRLIGEVDHSAGQLSPPHH